METLSSDIWKEIFSHIIDQQVASQIGIETEIRIQLVFIRRTSKQLYEICKKYTSLYSLRANVVFSNSRSNLCSYFASTGQLSGLIYWREIGAQWDKHTTIVAAEKAHLEILKYAIENGCEADRMVPASAAKNGHLHVLKYLHEERNFPWDELTCTAAAESGQLECLKYAHKSGCALTSQACRVAMRNGHMDCFNYIHAAAQLDCEHNQLRQEKVTQEYQSQGVSHHIELYFYN